VRALPVAGVNRPRRHGEVWRAHDAGTDRIVAIKVLPAHLSGDATFQQRFRREAQAAARLNTPM
jgi:serine/threonine protein kinase, bacterial